MVGFVVAGPLFDGPRADGVHRQRGALRRLVRDLPLGRPAPTPSRSPPRRAHEPGEGLRRYARILRGSHVWLLAPTWIAINATLGLYTSQTLFQLVAEAGPGVRRASS